MEIKNQPSYYVIICTLKYNSFDEAKADAPEEIASHIKRSKELHEKGTLIMSGVFLDKNNIPLKTMGILASHEDAEEYLKGDPFYLNGMMESWEIRTWANMFYK